MIPVMPTRWPRKGPWFVRHAYTCPPVDSAIVTLWNPVTDGFPL